MSTTAAPTGRPLPAPEREGSASRWTKQIWLLMGGTFLVHAAGFAYPFMSYRLTEAHFSTHTIGLILAVFGAGGLIGSIACGWLADRFGRRDTLIATLLLAAAALPVLAQTDTASVLFVAAFISGLVYDASRPIFTAEITDTYPDDPQRAASVNAWRHFTVNVGAAATGSIGGLLAGAAGIPALIWANAAACALFALLAWLVMKPDRTPVTASQNTSGANYRTAATDTALWLLLAASLAALTCASGLFSALPMLMERDGLSAADYGWAQAANAGAVLALSPLLNGRLARRAARATPMTGLFALSCLILGVSMGGAGLASSTLGYSTMAALAVPGEIAVVVAASDILARISPPTARGLYAGLWGAALAAASIIAPILAAWAISHGGGTLAGAAMLSVGVLGAVMCWPLTVTIRRTQKQTTAYL
ncbi:MFS transporter [Streptomyces europaeiscabiei]|uniref:MFS transporter n=1 Tax=Streptomyces europaeiscabiei TaxID=146819 RepID=UPI0029A79A88|nr:MFS transporter [Streptomyces europaeiscabiei]MDX3694766.1 MFS transporter [Streptomyces europaeiscabiei]